jgi:choline kinase
MGCNVPQFSGAFYNDVEIICNEFIAQTEEMKSARECIEHVQKEVHEYLCNADHTYSAHHSVCFGMMQWLAKHKETERE